MIDRLIVARWNGDVIAGDARDGQGAGCHLRTFEVETKAAAEAHRLMLAGETPPKAYWCVFAVREGSYRDATPQEVEQHYRWRVWRNWKAMRELAPARKPSAKRSGRKAVRP